MTAIQTGPSTPGLHLLAIPFVVVLVLFLGYSSQWLFVHLPPELGTGPPSTPESFIFNALLLCLWWTYYKACSVDPGRYVFSDETTTSSSPRPDASSSLEGRDGPGGDSTTTTTTATTASTATTTSTTTTTAAATMARYQHLAQKPRWCKKCQGPKPARAHHCRHCGRCVPKMDHHCPWTGNCVSLQTFPHFLRFLVYTNLALWALAAQLARRFYDLWASRRLPAYLGPTLPQLVHLTLLGLVCSTTMLALAVMLFTTTKGWLLNTTMIEGWELERHEALVDRYGPDGDQEPWWGDAEGREHALAALEFPYDLGFFRNAAQAMGTANPLLWFLPLAGGPRLALAPAPPDATAREPAAATGWSWEENGFNARPGMWPPPDPEKLSRASRQRAASGPGLYESPWHRAAQAGHGPDAAKAAFRARQAALDHARRRPGWANADGERLRDYGVDEEAEAEVGADGEKVTVAAVSSGREAADSHGHDDDDDDDVPLGELLRRRKLARPRRARDDERSDDSE